MCDLSLETWAPSVHRQLCGSFSSPLPAFLQPIPTSQFYFRDIEPSRTGPHRYNTGSGPCPQVSEAPVPMPTGSSWCCCKGAARGPRSTRCSRTGSHRRRTCRTAQGTGPGSQRETPVKSETRDLQAPLACSLAEALGRSHRTGHGRPGALYRDNWLGSAGHRPLE